MSDAKVDTRRLVGRLLLVTVLMFAFGFALVPLYDVMCRAWGSTARPPAAPTAANSRWMSGAR